jgi:hypothetical protein
MSGRVLSEDSTVVEKEDDKSMTQVIRNSKNKKVAEVNQQTKTVVIKQSDCRTTIQFVDDGSVKIKNTMVQNIR